MYFLKVLYITVGVNDVKGGVSDFKGGVSDVLEVQVMSQEV